MSTDAFCDDLAKDLSDPEFRRAYTSAALSIAAADAALNAEALSLDQDVSGDDRIGS